jgi:hypothetical protein
MNIQLEESDAPGFVAEVEQVIYGVLREFSPKLLVLIKVDNWFGSKWTSFSGKALGILGTWHRPLAVPPFVPNRIVSQKRFAAPDYVEIDPGEAINVSLPSMKAMKRKISVVAPETAIVWFSGNSQKDGRGCLLAYIPTRHTVDSHWQWYAAWKSDKTWELNETLNIKRADVLRLMGPTSSQHLL